MSSENTVKARPLVFGTAGTATVLSAPTTNTSNPYPLPRADFGFGITAYSALVTTTASTTASSTAAATCVFQVSNDNTAWFGVATASATATVMTTSTAVIATSVGTGAALANVAGARYAYGRGIVTLAGTGSAIAFLGS